MKIPVSEAAKKELLECVQWLKAWNRLGAPIRRPLGAAELRVVSDAGLDGFGYKIEGKSRQLTLQDQCVVEAGEWIGDDKDLWQVWRELRGVEGCTAAEEGLLAGKSVLVLSDAIGAVKYINDGTEQSVEMTAIMKRIFRLCVHKEISMRADREHLSGDKMKESGVDSLSRWGEF